MGRYVIYGAGGVGALIGARLFAAGRDVCMIARGPHGEAMARDGLRLKTARGEDVLRVPVVLSPSEAGISDSDTVVLAMKTHDALPALDKLAGLTGRETAIVCAQNGLESERAALRHFANVYAAFVYVFATYLEPGKVTCHTHPSGGIIDLGRYPEGQDARVQDIAADFRASGFASTCRPDIMRWKRGKLVINTGNGVSALCSEQDAAADIRAAARAEAEACFRAEGLDFVSPEEIEARAQGDITFCDVEGSPFIGGSTFQSLVRGAGTTEGDYLHGEVVLRGRLAGVPTPVNAGLQALLREIAARGGPAPLIPADELRKRIGA